MRFDKRSVLAGILLALSACPASAQTVTNHAFAIGRGPGQAGYTSALCTSAQLAVGQAAADPICRTVSGDVTIDATGATAIGASKVLNAQLATMAANTTKCNATAGTANPTDCTAATMRTNLALVPGTNVEAWDADLDALAALAGTGIARRTASNTWSVGTAVSNAELATMATNTVKANATSGAAVPTDFAVPSCSGASNALIWTTNSGFGCNSIAGAGSVIVPPTVRLTLTQGTAVTTSDVTAATSVFLEPYGGGYQVQVYDGVSAWSTLPVAPSTYSLPATQTQTCTLATSTTVTGCTDTSQMVVGEQVTGTNIPASDTIASITNSTSFVLASAATGSGATSLTFKLPPSKNYDVYVQNNGGIPRMVWSAAWSNDTTPPTRALQNGILVQSGTTTNRLLGSVRVSSTAGVLIDSAAICRCLSNVYNRSPRSLALKEASSTWTYSAAAWALVNNSGADTIGVIFTVPDFIDVTVNAMWSNSAAVGANAWVGVGVDSTSAPSSTLSNCNGSNASGITSTCIAEYVGSPGIGYHTFSFLQFGAGANTQTWYGTGGISDRIQSGITGMVLN